MEDDLLCKDDWDSTINGNNDGFFTLHIVDHGTGDIVGDHTGPDGTSHLVWGTCEHQGNRHHIRLWEFHGTFAFRYKAEILPDAGGRHKTKDGKRRKIGPISPARRQDDDDWVAIKTT